MTVCSDAGSGPLNSGCVLAVRMSASLSVMRFVIVVLPPLGSDRPNGNNGPGACRDL